MGLSSNIKAMLYMIKKNYIINMRYKADSLSILFRPIVGILPILIFANYIQIQQNNFYNYTGTSKYISYLTITYFFIAFITDLMVSASVLITMEMQRGTLATLMLSPVNAIQLFFGNLIAELLVQIFDFFIFYILISLIFRESIVFQNVWLMFYVIFISSLVAFGLGILLAGVTMKTKSTNATFMINSFLIFIAGVSYPITIFPTWLKSIALLNPITYCVDLMRYSVLGTFTYLNSNVEILIASLFNITLFILGIKFYRKIVRGLKETGQLVNY
ncbi:MAG: ABC transporter permease [Halanaerobiales bacterium]|nr:ABC transporter permease [Halanaerobiales bacterium]